MGMIVINEGSLDVSKSIFKKKKKPFNNLIIV